MVPFSLTTLSLSIVNLMLCLQMASHTHSFSTLNPWCSPTLASLNMQELPSHLRTCCVAFKTGFILLTFTGTSLTLIFHPLHMSILYRCNRKKKKSNSHPPLRDFSHREQSSSQWQASAVQKKVHTGRSPVRIPGTVEMTTEQNGSCQLEPNLENALTHLFYTHN